MLNNRKFAAASIVTAIAVLGAGLTLRSYHKDLYGRFPDIDRKVVRQAYRKFVARAAKGQIDTDGLTDAEMDRLFLQEIAEIYAT